jgi:hypothetical protein
MANYPPFMNAYNLIPRILDKIKNAKTPERFTQDFLETNLGFKGGSARAFIPLAKKMGLLNSDGTPTELYRIFRNPSESKIAVGKAMKKGYGEVFSRNEHAYKLDKKEFEGLIIEMTGLNKKTSTLGAICNTFDVLKSLADFESENGEKDKIIEDPGDNDIESSPDNDMKLNLSYVINLVLPKTDDIGVFNAIFKSLKENLLKK